MAKARVGWARKDRLGSPRRSSRVLKVSPTASTKSSTPTARARVVTTGSRVSARIRRVVTRVRSRSGSMPIATTQGTPSRTASSRARSTVSPAESSGRPTARRDSRIRPRGNGSIRLAASSPTTAATWRDRPSRESAVAFVTSARMTRSPGVNPARARGRLTTRPTPTTDPTTASASAARHRRRIRSGRRAISSRTRATHWSHSGVSGSPNPAPKDAAASGRACSASHSTDRSSVHRPVASVTSGAPAAAAIVAAASANSPAPCWGVRWGQMSRRSSLVVRLWPGATASRTSTAKWRRSAKATGPRGPTSATRSRVTRRKRGTAALGS